MKSHLVRYKAQFKNKYSTKNTPTKITRNTFKSIESRLNRTGNNNVYLKGTKCYQMSKLNLI